MLKKSKTKNALRKISSLLLSGILFCTCAIHSYAASTYITVDGAGVSRYGSCKYGNRAGKEYIDGLYLGMCESLNSQGIVVQYSTHLENDSVTKTALSNMSRNNATLLAYSGHGIKYDTSTNNAWHLNTNHGSSGSHFNASSNMLTTNLAQTKHQYVVAHTCNFLTNGGYQSKLDNMYKIGARVLCGFCSTMFLDSREGLYFGRLLGTQSVRSAFLNAAATYQPRIGAGNKVIARAMGLNGSYYEKINAGQSLAPSYSTNKSLYGIMQTMEIAGKSGYDPGYN